MTPKQQEYLKQAEVCRSEALRAQLPEFQEAWLKLAHGWLEMERRVAKPADSNEAAQFDRLTGAVGTGQEDSTTSH